jgi:predicted ATPase
LALEIARAIVAESAARVAFVPLAAVRTPAFVASAIAEGLGLSDVTALDLPMRARVACVDRPTLLVLDNFEQILDAAPLVVDLLTSVASLEWWRPAGLRSVSGRKGVRRRTSRVSSRCGCDVAADLARSPA